jgi:hypothetical protein
VRAWAIGVILLGSGAEHLKAELKQELSRQLVVLGSAIIHHWTEKRLKVDFSNLKTMLTNEDTLRKFSEGSSKTGTNLKDTKSFINMLVDWMEYYLLSQPFLCVTNYLCEQARHRVLATSVEKAGFDSPIEKVLHSTWLADIDSQRGKAELDKAIRALPNSPFLRINLAAHFLTRVHWNHWKKEDRLALLDAAEEALKPLAVNFNKGELKRVIEGPKNLRK